MFWFRGHESCETSALEPAAPAVEGEVSTPEVGEAESGKGGHRLAFSNKNWRELRDMVSFAP